MTTTIKCADGISVYCSFDELADTIMLVPNPRNPNKHSDKQVELLAKIIKNQGWRAPITVSNRSGFIVRGHGRLLAAQRLGVSLVPADRQDYATEAEEWADLIADNRIAELSEIDNALLGQLLGAIDDDFDIELTGFSAKDVDKILTEIEAGEVTEDDFDPAAKAALIKAPVTQQGDIWILGRHRLMCGDASSPLDVEKLMSGIKADAVFTDPPYNVDYTGKTADALKIKNDKLTTEEFRQFLLDAFTNIANAIKAGGAVYVCHADSEGYNFRGAFQDAGFKLKQCIIWVKQHFVMGRQDYQWQHEPILYGWKEGASHSWYGDRKQSTVWEVDRPMANREHPTMKPVALVARALINSTKSEDVIFDPFGGSGSTMIAAEQIGRSCYMVELDPVYCDVIVKRWEEFTGQKARKKASC